MATKIPLHKQSEIPECAKVLIISQFNDRILDDHFWFLWNMKHHNHATFINQKVIIQIFIIELAGDKYFTNQDIHTILATLWHIFIVKEFILIFKSGWQSDFG